MIESEKIIYYLTMINQRLNKLIEAKLLSKNKKIEQVMSSLKPPIFWKDKPLFLTQFKKWNIDQIKLALKKHMIMKL